MSLGNANSGQLVPVYTVEDVQNWAEGGTSTLITLTEVFLIVLAVIGFMLFAVGIVQYMKENRNSDLGGGGAERFPAKWFVLAGVAFGSMGSIFYLVVRAMKVG